LKRRSRTYRPCGTSLRSNATRRAGLSNPATEVVFIIDDELLAGYVEVAPHASVPGAVYISSLQIAARYRGGGVLPRLLIEARRVLKPRQVKSIRSNVLRLNKTALIFFGRLGFEIHDSTPHSASLDVYGGPELLDSPLLARLSARYTSTSRPGSSSSSRRTSR
jgi:ribosomal protein S18 acetylase RimI-like enzyme